MLLQPVLKKAKLLTNSYIFILGFIPLIGGRNLMKEYFENNKLTFLIVLSAIIIGITIGSSSVARLSDEDASELYSTVNTSVNTTSVFFAFLKSLSSEFKRFIILFLCGTTVFGSPVSVFFIGYTGYSLGFTVAFMLKYYGLTGLLAAFLGILPHYIVLLPTYCFAGVVCINFSNNILLEKKNFNYDLKKFLVKMIIVLFMIFFACILEGFISAFFLKKIFALIN